MPSPHRQRPHLDGEESPPAGGEASQGFRRMVPLRHQPARL